ncbi:MAG TPA: DinB family protein, partial [Candidatus Sulfotelmatobacter sp.]|nr:DinB family protein [Candidatus Sulfotelmatobacter sp.]
MKGRPSSTEAPSYYFGYIKRITSDDVLPTLETQLHETMAQLRSISEERSLYRYAPEKWSVRQMWSHINDTERVFVFRA